MNALKIWDKTNDLIGQTPLHPQYFVIKYQKHILKKALPKIQGEVLDVGCGRQLLKGVIEKRGHNYTSLDHPKIYTRQRAERKPDILADIADIPAPNSLYDSILLFMVLPHLQNPPRGLKEIHRILKNNGLVFISAVENYPAHALPDDYFRFRISGLTALCKEAGLKPIDSRSYGNFWEVNSLNFNVFLMQTAKHLFDKTKNVALTIAAITLLYPLMIVSNITALILGPLDFIKTSRLVNFVIARKNV